MTDPTPPAARPARPFAFPTALPTALVLALTLGAACGGPAPQPDGGGEEPGGVTVVDGPGGGVVADHDAALLESLRALGYVSVDDDDAADAGAGATAAEGEPDEPLADGLHFRLSDAGAATPGGVDRPHVTPRPLTGAAADALLQRLPPLPALPGDAVDFAFRDRSLPAPRPGDTIERPFPFAEDGPPPVDVATLPLSVLRATPEGEVPIASHLSVAFSHAMVALDRVDAIPGEGFVELEPQPAGRWRWIDTRTLAFEPEGGRFPAATRYRVTVPFGTHALDGSELRDVETWSFATPPPRLTASWPRGGPTDRQPTVVMVFDQRMDAAAVLSHLRLQAGGRNHPVRPLTDEELAAARAPGGAFAAIGDRPAGTWVAFRPTERLAGATSFRVALPSGLASAEGPRRTEEAQGFEFRTYGPFRFYKTECGYQHNCRPGTPFELQFTNPIDPTSLGTDGVTVTPAVEDMTAWTAGSSVWLRGRTEPETVYEVVLAAGLRDVFGQVLEEETRVTFRTGEAHRQNPWFQMGGQLFVVLDPWGDGSYPVHSVNYERIDLALYAVEAGQWGDFIDDHEFWSEVADGGRPTPPGRKVWETTLDLSDDLDRYLAHRVDLTPALGADGVGHALLVARPLDPDPHHKGWRPRSQFRWIQRGGAAVDALLDREELVAWATSLRDGAPLAGARVRLMPEGLTATADDEGLARLPLPPDAGETRRWLEVTPAGAGEGGGEGAAFDAVTTILPESDRPAYGRHRRSGWRRTEPPQRTLWHVFDDRAMYKPGERVHVAGWVRLWDGREGGDTGALLPASGSWPGDVTWTVRDARNNEVGSGTASLSERGGFDLAFDLPDAVNLGPARVELRLPGGLDVHSGSIFHHGFQVQEFRRPEYEVTVTAGPGPHFIGEHAEAFVKAAYYAGGPLPGAEVEWIARTVPGHFRPPNRDDFVFGEWSPWWGWRETVTWGGPRAGHQQKLAATTDATGRHDLRIDFDAAVPPRPFQLTVEGAVTDVNRQRWAASAGLLVHPAAHYVGLRAERTFVQKGEDLRLDVIVTDLDGTALVGRPVDLRAWRTRWVSEQGEWKEVEADLQEVTLTSGAEAVPVSFEGREGGRWSVQATVHDEQQRPNRTRMMMWVAGGEPKPSTAGLEHQEVQLIPDRETYRPGDEAQLLIQSPIAEGTAIVRLMRSGTLSTRRVRLDGGSATLAVPITDAHVPNLHVRVDVVGRVPRTDDEGAPLADAPPRPAYASGSLDLKVPPLGRGLTVAVTPRDAELSPGAATAVDLDVRDSAGEPLTEGEAVLVVVDEAVLALTGYQLVDPLATFYPARSPDSWESLLRRFLILAEPGEFDGSGEGPDGGDPDGDGVRRGEDDDFEERARRDGGGGPFAYELFGGEADSRAAGKLAMAPMAQLESLGYLGTPVEEGAAGEDCAPAVQPRTNFDALAVFATRVPVRDGEASVDIELPDNLTRYRVMAVAVDKARLFGKGEGAITARLPLMVRPSAPRFLNFGDVFELPVVLQNGTDEDMEVGLALRAANAELRAGAAWRVTVPASDRVEVRVPAAAGRPGTARFSILAAATDDVDGRRADAARIELPTWTPATTEAFAIHGVLDEGAVAQGVIAPSDVVPEWGGLSLTTSSTALAALTDAFLYVYEYPYGCAEQVASRVLSAATLREVLEAFDAPGLPDAEALERSMAADIAKLAALQNGDGGWGYWRRDGDSVPYLSVHVTLALQVAKDHGYEVPQHTLDRARNRIAGIRELMDRHRWYGEDLRRSIEAFALSVRARMGDVDGSRARGLLSEAGLDGLPLEAAGWLLTVFAAEPGGADEVTRLLRHFGNRAVETAGAANFTSRYGEGAYVLLHSERRTDGVILDALLAARPDHDLVPKVVAGLMAHKKKGRWGNTQENAFILLALKHYFDRFESVDPDFVARVWLGERYAAEAQYRGRSTDRHEVTIPMAALRGTAEAPEPLVLAKEGEGRLYYRLGLSYAPSDLDLAPADHGFEVERRYEAIEDPDDVTLQPDGTWRVALGAPVRVKVTMVARSQRAHVALVDPLPAGLEASNPALAVTGSLPTGPADDASSGNSGDDHGLHGRGLTLYRPWWNRPWYEHQNLRDERVEAFRSWLPAGVYTYEYIARATTPGVFVVPPAKAEEMYTPETFGRSGSDRVIVD